MEEVEEMGVHFLAGEIVGLLPEVAVDAQIVGYGGITALSDSVIHSLTCFDVSRQKVDLDVELRPYFAQEFTELLQNLNFCLH